MRMNPMLQTDYYKVVHPMMYAPGTEVVYSNLTARSSRRKDIDHVVFFGLQYFIKEYLIKRFNEDFFDRPLEEVVEEYKRAMRHTVGDLKTYDHIIALHKLGYLPVEIRAIDEGTKVPIKVPMLVIKNTLPEFFWVTNFLESLMSSIIWQPITSATIANRYREIFTEALDSTIGDTSFVDFMGHDFSFRGMGGLESAILSGMGHLTSFKGTDTIPAIVALEEYYGANIENELVGCSVPATEHSIMSAGTAVHGELETFRWLIEDVYPDGIISIVSDTFDLWEVLTNYMPSLKDVINNRNGKVVIRPDSGDPVDIICGTEIPEFNTEIDCMIHMMSCVMNSGNENTIRKIVKVSGKINEVMYPCSDGEVFQMKEVDISPNEKGVIELLWDTFGGTIVNGYKVLSDKVGAIYGDSITIERAEEITRRLKAKGFAPIIVYGIGSYTYQYQTRDTFGMAVKATAIEYNGELIEIFKDPITDDGVKKSLRGLFKVHKDESGKLCVIDRLTATEAAECLLTTVFRDGKLVRETTLSEIRERLT